MGRKAIPVTKTDLQKTVDAVEGLTGFPSVGELWNAVSQTEWAKSLKLSPQVAAMKAKKFGVTFKSQKGQRGRQAGQGFPAGVKRGRKPRTFNQERFNQIMSGIPKIEKVKGNDCMTAERHEHIAKFAKRAATGNLRAIIRLKCLECTAWQPNEIRTCDIVACPSHGVRPFRTAEEKSLKISLEVL